ncbi:MAG: hypothetical protein II816_00835 [Elusimicrobia bacterium]|nr:hypothetical protein [Elusimicrobiota bacterium]
MSKGFITTISFILLIIVSLAFVIFEKNQLKMVEITVNNLEAEYQKIENETNLIRAEINSVLALEKLVKTAKEKNFSKPSQDRIITIK